MATREKDITTVQRAHISILTSSGGAGHKIVASALAKKMQLNRVETKTHDVMHEFLGCVGKKITSNWNRTYQKGNMQKCRWLINQQPIANLIFFIPIFFKTLRMLKREKPLTVINTQILGTRAIALAIRYYNFTHKKRNFPPVKMQLWMSDLPDKGKHFFSSIKRMSRKSKNIIEIYVPIAKQNVDLTLEMTKRKTRLKNHQIRVLKPEDLPTAEEYQHPSIKNFAPKQKIELTFELPYPHQAEALNAITKTISDWNTPSQIQAEDRVISLMLGSLPSETALQRAVDAILTTPSPAQPHHYFLFCGRDESDQPSIFKTLVKKLQQCQIPDRVNIIPLPFQNQSVLAKMMARSDIRITKAGGSTSFEHLVLKKQLGEDSGKVYIYTDTGNKPSNEENIKKSMFFWEWGNVLNLKGSIGAKCITASDFPRLFDETP